MTTNNKMQFSKSVLLAFFSLLSISIYAQTSWTNQVYKPDVAKIEYNPMKGLIPGYSGINSNFPYSTDHFYIDLKSTYTNWNTYDWSTFESKLNGITSRGCHAIARFWIDYPNETYGMPTFLQSLVPAEDYTAQGNTVGKSKLPNWNNETLMTAIEQFIAAFGARYDGDPRLIMVEAGLYGFWGEWHTSGTSGKEMNQTNKDRIINAYLRAFTKTHIGLRQANHPGTIDMAKKLGYYDDSFCYSTVCTSGNWCFMYSLKGRALIDNYKYHPMGGEIYPETQKTLFDAWPNALVDATNKKIAEDITTSVNESHMSFNKCFFIFKQQPTATQYANAMKMHKMMGYEFFVHSVQMTLNSQKQLNVNVNLQNLGVAPFYYNWQVEFAAITTKGILYPKIGTADWEITSLYPSKTDKYLRSFTCSLPTAEKHYIMMRFKNPLDSYSSSAKQLRFANATQDEYMDGWLALGIVDVSTGVEPINTEQANVDVFYNAKDNKLQIHSKDNKISNLQIYSVKGQLIVNKNFNSNNIEIQNNFRLNDLVLLKITVNNKIYTKKIILK